MDTVQMENFMIKVIHLLLSRSLHKPIQPTQGGKIMIRNIFAQAIRLITDYPAEKEKKEALRKQMEIREAEFEKRFYKKQSVIRKTRR